MKKISAFILGILLISSLQFAQAKSNSTSPNQLRDSSFVDHFYLAGATIQAVSSKEGYLIVTKISDTYFTDQCSVQGQTYDGRILLNVTNQKNGSCQLTIVDGPFETNPYVESSSCQNGMQFTGIDHATFTYDYTLKFQ